MQERILVIGSADMELLLPSRALPRAGESSEEEGRYAYSAGGIGTVAALALSDLGAKGALCARLGNDSHGAALSRLYHNAGLEAQGVTIDSRSATGLRVTVEEDNGDSRVIYYPGANRNLQLIDIDRALSSIQPEAVYLCADIPAEALAGACRLAASRGIPVFLDGTGIDPDAPLSSLAGVEFFCAEDKEIEALTGTFPAGTDSCLKAVVTLEKRLRARYYLIKLGERGLFLYDGRYCHMIPGHGMRMGADATISEMAFPGAVLEYLRAGRDPLTACRFGMALNALLHKNAADRNYFPTIDEIRDFATRH